MSEAATGTATSILDVSDVSKSFPASKDLLGRVTARLQAVVQASLSIAPGETLGLVGESGSGKSTLGRLVMRLLDVDAGRIVLEGSDITEARGSELRAARRKMQIVFQDPQSSLDPNWLVRDIIAEPLRAYGVTRAEREAATERLLVDVGLEPTHGARYASEFSGGQRQRVAIARALALEPNLVVCDEPVSALDVSTQAQVLSLLESLRDRRGLAYLFIAHDLAVVHHISHRIAVMYLGRIVEVGPADEICRRPRHPYTEALLSAMPSPNPADRRQRILLTGEMPSPVNTPPGCRFQTRCTHAMDRCREIEPELVAFGDVEVACHLHDSGPILAGASVTVIPRK
ncbi:ABC transporter ATP-binding protein [Candidatus Poriferisodalis sp.]|uniref:ABC transporter ATP-binding protein n=1 Tax=Candidatus Poriferisodalis sp. TaxID=3101277 RepID=UPI003AF6009F